MIYECPNCHAPQAPGRTSCFHCGAEFDGPVPDDAILTPPPAEEGETAAPQAGGVSPVMPAGNPLPTLEDVSPAAPAYQAPLPYQPPPYQAPPPYQPSSGMASPAAYTPSAPSSTGFRLPKALLIAIPIVLALVLGGVWLAGSLNQSAEAPPPRVVSAPPVRTSAPAPTGPPMVLPGGGFSSSGGSVNSSPVARWLVGRWQNKDTDFYVFNDNGTGYRGSISGKQAKASFLWQVVQNQIALDADAEKPEKLAFSKGSDENSMYLRGPDGRYIQYTRTKEGL